jgi:hypothetical protein
MSNSIPQPRQAKREQPNQPTNHWKQCKSQAKDHNPTTKAKATKEREATARNQKTTYPVQENHNPKK